MIAAYAIVYSIVCGIRYRHYLYTDFDLAIFAQATDGILRGTLDSSIRGMPWLGDHSSLVLFLIAPVYALFRDPLTLLVLQSIALALGALPVHALARRELQDARLALAFAAMYLLQAALGYANLFEFHPEMLATPLLVTSFYFLRAGRSGRALAAAGVALLCREDVALVVFMLALYAAFWLRPRQPRAGAVLGAAALASLALTLGVLRPHFSHGEAEYANMYAQWGDTPGSALLAMLGDPLRALASLVSTPGNPKDTLIKLQYHAALLLPFGLLPLLSPVTLLLALPAMAEHLLSQRVAQHTVLCQYTALVIPFVSAAAVLGTRNLLALLARTRLRRGGPENGAAPAGPPRLAAPAVMFVGLGAALACSAWFGPLLGSGNFFLTETRDRVLPNGVERATTPYRDRMIEQVPPQGAVVASLESLHGFTRRAGVHSLHHVVRGTYTYSSLPYPQPEGVGALVADFGAANVVRSVDGESAGRLQDLVVSNGLTPVSANGDLVLFLQAPDTLALLAGAPCGDPDGQPVVFDTQLEFLGARALDRDATAGGTVRLQSCWRVRGSIDRFFMIEWDVVDAGGRVMQRTSHSLGYVIYAAHTWPRNVPIREDYRLILADDLAPGVYRIRLRVRWRGLRAEGDSEPGDPAGYDRVTGVEIGRFVLSSAAGTLRP